MIANLALVPQLGARFLVSVCSVNNFRYADRVQLSEGDSATIYLQLVDRNQDPPSEGYQPPYRRYVPATGSTLRVTARNLDSAVQFTRSASQPFPGDASIWSFSVYSTDRLRGSVSLTLDLLESGTHIYANVQPALLLAAKPI